MTVPAGVFVAVKVATRVARVPVLWAPALDVVNTTKSLVQLFVVVGLNENFAGYVRVPPEPDAPPMTLLQSRGISGPGGGWHFGPWQLPGLDWTALSVT